MSVKQIQGMALKNSKDKTVVVQVKFLKIHPLYKKRFFVNRQILAQTDKDIKAGQIILIQECRPVSRRKAWKVIEAKK